MSNSYIVLFESIRVKCEKEGWFGPDTLNPHQYDGVLEYDPTFDKQTITAVSLADPRCSHFVFPPANEEQLRETEKQLGFVLPPLLRALHTQVANGGFGPVAGFKGIIGGYGSVESGTHSFDTETILDQYIWRSEKRTIDLAKYEGQWTTSNELLLPYGEWPRYMLPICDLGCVQEACVDTDQQMFLVAPVEQDDVYCLWKLPWTFEEWLWRWVRDEELIPRY